MSDVEGHDADGAALQQHVGEAAGGGADVERLAAGDGHVKGVERVGQLHASAPDVRMIRRNQRDIGIVGNLGARFRHRLPADADLSGQDQRPRAFARGGKALVHDELIEPKFHDAPDLQLPELKFRPT